MPHYSRPTSPLTVMEHPTMAAPRTYMTIYYPTEPAGIIFDIHSTMNGLEEAFMNGQLDLSNEEYAALQEDIGHFRYANNPDHSLIMQYPTGNGYGTADHWWFDNGYRFNIDEIEFEFPGLDEMISFMDDEE